MLPQGKKTGKVDVGNLVECFSYCMYCRKTRGTGDIPRKTKFRIVRVTFFE